MVKVVIIEKLGNIKNSDFKNFDIENLHKKCNFRKKEHFELRHTWSLDKDNLFVSLFAKDKGRANSENKYDLPPPLDNKLYFGSIVLVKHKDKTLSNENVKDVSINDWKNLYEKLFGGFEDLNGDNDSYSEEEEIPEHFKTKEGYSKEDGFIVDDDEDLDEEYIPEESEEEAHSSTDSAHEDEEVMGEESDIGETDDEEEFDEEDEYDESESDVGSELSEESYVDSDCD